MMARIGIARSAAAVFKDVNVVKQPVENDTGGCDQREAEDKAGTVPARCPASDSRAR